MVITTFKFFSYSLSQKIYFLATWFKVSELVLSFFCDRVFFNMIMCELYFR